MKEPSPHISPMFVARAPRCLRVAWRVAARTLKAYTSANALSKRLEGVKDWRPQPVPEVTFDEFQRVRIHAGTIVEAAPNPRARVPAYVLRIDFGALGMRTSSAQLTRNYTPEDLVGRQIVAVMNFPPKRVAGVKSEVLVLGTVTDEDGVVLLHPSFPVANGALVA